MKLKKTLVISLLLLTLLDIGFPSTKPVLADGTCSTQNVVPIDLGTGITLDPDWFLDVWHVFSTQSGGDGVNLGQFLFLNPFTDNWEPVAFKATSRFPTDENETEKPPFLGTRFGVSTEWVQKMGSKISCLLVCNSLDLYLPMQTS